ADHRYGVPWQVLAAINEIESNYGRNLSVSSAGALGWMQFMPGTWAQWGVDADHDGARNPYSPLDAIFAAARYLKASGAQRDLPAAIYAYNHAHWYVTEVLMRARMLEHDVTSDGSQKGYALPLDRRYMTPLGHTGDAVSLGQGHIEIGFSDAAGDPLSHHGAEAWTPAGAVMRSFLVTLSDAFHAHNG